MINPQDIELIEQFFRQELSGEALFDFETRVKNDPEFSAEVIALRALFYGVRSGARKQMKEDLRELEGSLQAKDFKPYKPGFRAWWKGFFGVITVVIIATGAYWLYPLKGPHPLSQTPQSPPSVNPSSLTLIKDPSDTTLRGMEADLHLNVKDPSTFSIKKLAKDPVDGLYRYEVKADGNTQVVESANPELESEFLSQKEDAMREADESQHSDSVARKKR